MNRSAFVATCAGLVGSAVAVQAIDLKQSKITQVVNDVEIISAASQSEKQAKVNDQFNIPDVLRTGASSRAELIASDETVTRVGANTIFSFDPANRSIDLKQGSLLFHSPHGKGGGTIHTGAATASVLGTTLIVTTTPSGGMKVLDLEGNVEVKFLNGLKQNLNPGQMTFVLPGGNQLAPIIVYRLDDVAKNGQLVKGFNNPLSSMPLIEQEIEKQLKLINSGRYTDTGLLVGNDATSDKVQVIDPTTLETALNNSGQPFPSGADATFNQGSLTAPSVPTPPQHVFLDQTFILPNNSFFIGQPFTGFAARNIFFDAPVAPDSPVLNMDLSPYANLQEFDMVAAQNIYVNNSVSFGGFSPQDNIFFDLVAGNQFIITPGANLTANVANLEMESGKAFTLNGSTVANSFGNTGMEFGGDFTMENGAQILTFGNLAVQTTGNININASLLDGNSILLGPAHGDINVTASTVISSFFTAFHSTGDVNVSGSVLNTDRSAGSMQFTSDKGSVNLHNDTIQTQYLVVNSGDGILLDGNGQVYASSGSGSIANFTAAKIITVNNADFSQFTSVNMAANTINLSDVAFGGSSTVTLRSLLGVLNVGSSVPGDVNFINNVTYGGNPAQNYVNNGGGITVTTLH